MNRRKFMVAALGGIVATLSALKVLPGTAWASSQVQQYRLRFLRPPGALAEADFLSRCIRCGQCAEVCPNHCIQYFDLESRLTASGTPYIIPREQACILCMKCGNICPTGALRSIAHTAEAIVDQVHMGKARVDRSLCLSWQGKTCGVCYRACPLPDISLRVGRLEQPHVLDKCVGCGICERACIQMPQAIRVIPDYEA